MTQRLESIGAPLAVFLCAALVTALLLGAPSAPSGPSGPSGPAVDPVPRAAAGPPEVAAPKRPRLASVAALPAPLRRAANRTVTGRRVAPPATPSSASVPGAPAAAAQPASPAAPPPAPAPAPASAPAPAPGAPQAGAPAPRPTPAPTFDDSGSGPQFDDGGNGP
jgi:hypothetical protein